MLYRDPFEEYPPASPPVQPQAPYSRPPRRFVVELAKFLGIFLFFFCVLSLIVMGPTIYTNLSYYFFDPQDNKYNLPVAVDNDLGDIEDLAEFFELQEFIPPEDTIVIPRINVDAPIVYMDSTDNRDILEAIKDGVGHYPGTAMPGRIGNSFMTAHSSYYWWSGGEYNQVFALLDKLVPGDLVYIYYDGGKYIYRIRKSFVVHPTDVDVLTQGDKPILTLMTCTPLGTNLRRLIVQADLVGRPPVDTTDFRDFQQIPETPVILPL